MKRAQGGEATTASVHRGPCAAVLLVGGRRQGGRATGALAGRAGHGDKPGMEESEGEGEGEEGGEALSVAEPGREPPRARGMPLIARGEGKKAWAPAGEEKEGRRWKLKKSCWYKYSSWILGMLLP